MGFYLELLFDLHLCLSDDGVRARGARHSPARCADPCRCATGSGSRAECFEFVSATRPGGGAALERGRCGRGERVADRSWRGEHHGGLARQPARGAGRPGTRPRHANDAIERVSRVHRSRDDRTRARRSPRHSVRLDPRLDPSPPVSPPRQTRASLILENARADALRSTRRISALDTKPAVYRSGSFCRA